MFGFALFFRLVYMFEDEKFKLLINIINFSFFRN